MVNKMINNIKELIKIDKKEVLRYLQYKNQNINEDLSNLIDESIEETKKIINPKFVLRRYPIKKISKENGKKQVILENGNLILVTVTVEKDGTKSFNLPVGSIAVKNLDDNLRMNFVSQDDLEVHVRGNEDVLESISIEHAASIDLKDLNKAGIYTVPVKINLPGGCTLEVDVEIAIELEEKQ